MLKRIAIAGGVLVVVGVIGMSISAANGHGITINGNPAFNWLNFRSVQISTGSSIYAQKQANAAGVQSIRVESDAAAVEVLPGQSNKATVVLSGTSTLPSKDYQLTEKVTKSQLDISFKQTPKIFHVSTTQNLHVTVTIPKREYDAITVQAEVGKVSVHDLTSKETTVHLQSGEVTAAHLTGALTATANAGKVGVTDVNGPLHLTANTGAITVTQTVVTHSIDVSSNVGAIKITSNRTPANLGVDLKTNLGEVTANIPGMQYSENSRTAVKGTIGSGSPQITASSNVGAVVVN